MKPISPSKLHVWYVLYTKEDGTVGYHMIIHEDLKKGLEMNVVPGEIFAVAEEVPEGEWRGVEVGSYWKEDLK